LLSIMQMPPGIPVLSVGVNKTDIAVKNAIRMLKVYDNVKLIGDKDNDAFRKAVDVLKKFNIRHEIGKIADDHSINIELTYFDEPIAEKDKLVMYCPLLLRQDDKAEAALNILKHSYHGLWVGLNRGDNAALAAIEILSIYGRHDQQIMAYREEMKKKVLESNK